MISQISTHFLTSEVCVHLHHELRTDTHECYVREF